MISPLITQKREGGREGGKEESEWVKWEVDEVMCGRRIIALRRAWGGGRKDEGGRETMKE